MRYIIFLAFLWAGFPGVAPVLAETTGVLDGTNGAREIFSLPAKPAALVGVASVGEPQVHFSGHLAKMYDADAVGDQVGSVLGDVLHNSGRFALTESEHPQYRCKVFVNNLEIQQAQSDSATGFQKLSSFVKKFQPGGNLSMLTNIDLSKSDLTLSVKCTVRLEFYNEATEQLVAGATGTVEEKGTTKSVALNVGGVSLVKRDLPGSQTLSPTNSFDLQCRLIGAAALRALVEVLPEVDQQLLHPSATAAVLPRAEEKEKAAIAPREPVALVPARGLTCPSCGKPVTINDRFCPSCGKPLPHFCPHCGKPVKVGDKFCPNCGQSLAEP